MAVVNMQELLKAGVHFGHQKRKWNPKMAKYIFAERNGTYIIDLRQTLRMLREACDYLRDITSQGEVVLFVGTKRQAAETIAEEAKRCGMFYVNERWLGGMLTNFSTIRKSVTRLNELERMEQDGTFDLLPKKEVTDLKRQKGKLEKNLSGIREMNKLPSAVIIMDTLKEKIAVLEASKLMVPSIAIVDTKCDPDQITYPIPGNDDAIRSIKLICEILADAILEGRSQIHKAEAEEETPGEPAKQQPQQKKKINIEEFEDEEEE